MKLCKNCKHYRWFILSKDLSKCKSHNRPIKTDVSPVTGIIKEDSTLFCVTARMEWYPPMCGPEARWFEPK